MKLNLTDDIIKEGTTGTLIEKSKFCKECAIRFADLLELELSNERNQKEIPDTHNLEVFCVYSAIIKLMVQFSGQDDSKIGALYKEALNVSRQIREYEEKQKNEESKIIIP